MGEQITCGLCGQPMPPGEEVFMYHGHSGPCPTPVPDAPVAQTGEPTREELQQEVQRLRTVVQWGGLDPDAPIPPASPDIDWRVMREAYDWTVDDDGSVLGLTRADQHWEATGIVLRAGVAAPDGELHDAVAAARLEELRWVLNRAGVIQGRRIGEYRADLSDDIRARIAGLLTPTDRGTPQSGQEEA